MGGKEKRAKRVHVLQRYGKNGDEILAPKVAPQITSQEAANLAFKQLYERSASTPALIDRWQTSASAVGTHHSLPPLTTGRPCQSRRGAPTTPFGPPRTGRSARS